MVTSNGTTKSLHPLQKDRIKGSKDHSLQAVFPRESLHLAYALAKDPLGLEISSTPKRNGVLRLIAYNLSRIAYDLSRIAVAITPQRDEPLKTHEWKGTDTKETVTYRGAR